MIMQSRREFIGNVTAAAGTLAVPGRVLGANDKIRLGLIGPGVRGKQLLRYAMKCPNAEVVAFADIYTRRLEEAKAAVPAAKTYMDYRYLLDDKSIDAVLIASPQHLHCEHFVAALGAGKHVYQEKTMAFSVDHAKRMRAAYRKTSGLKVQIGYQDCSSPQIEEAQGFLEKGYVGKITEIHSHMYRNTPHGKPQWARPVPPDATPENVIWKSFLGEAPQREFDANRYVNWRFFWDYSGGNFYENMCHQLAFWYKALKLEIPKTVSTVGGVFLWKDGREVPDTMLVGMVHSEDLLFNWDSGFGNDQLGITEDVLGTDGTISRAEGQKLRYRPETVNRREPGEMFSETAQSYRISEPALVQDFVDCVRTGREPRAPFELGFRTAIACRMAVESYRQARLVRWDAVKEEIV
jgi:predicted dehydrogenase